MLLNRSTKLIKAIEYLTQIVTWIISEGIIRNMKDVFVDPDVMMNFEELHKLLTTNPDMTRQFANYLNDNVLFPVDE